MSFGTRAVTITPQQLVTIQLQLKQIAADMIRIAQQVRELHRTVAALRGEKPDMATTFVK